MDSNRFDELARAFGTGRSRRQVLKTLAGGLAGALAGAVGQGTSAAPKPKTCKNSHSCPQGQRCCNGTCTTLDTVTNCGSCGNSCTAPANATASCVSGQCQITCDTGFSLCGGACVNTKTDLANCGTCGTACTFSNGTATCDNGMCTLQGCATGYGNCDSAAANGCETDLQTEIKHCGSCDTICPGPTSGSGTATCTGGQCGISCAGGTTLCGGACVALDTVTNCGACGTACTFSNGTATCDNGMCTLQGCATGYGNCDSAAANGCETDLQTDINHCGTCDTVCPTGASCVGGQCACPAGTKLCGGTCTPIDTVTNCGSCGNACGGSTCTSATCTSGTCGTTPTNEGGACTRADGTTGACAAGVCGCPATTCGRGYVFDPRSCYCVCCGANSLPCPADLTPQDRCVVACIEGRVITGLPCTYDASCFCAPSGTCVNGACQ
jgi:hypothetical protein